MLKIYGGIFLCADYGPVSAMSGPAWISTVSLHIR